MTPSLSWREKLAAARIRCTQDPHNLQTEPKWGLPFMAPAVFGLNVVHAPGIGTLAVDEHMRVYVDPEFCEALPVHDLAAVVAHEATHVLSDHANRARRIFPEARLRHPGLPERTLAYLWNLAADAAVNESLRNSGVKLPGVPVTFGSLGLSPCTVEEAFERLLQRKEEEEDPGGDAKRQDIPSPPKDRGKMWDCGSCSDGIPRPYEVPSDRVRKLSQTEQDLVRRQVALRIKGSPFRGTDPGGWRRWAEDFLQPPRVPWQRKLKAAVRDGVHRARGAQDYTYARFSARQSPGLILPATDRPIPVVSVILDTSGSMSEVQLADGLREVCGILRSSGSRVRFYSVDAAVHVVKTVLNPRELSDLVVGGGGTDMGVGIQRAMQDRPHPDVLVVITDGLTPWPQEKPPCRSRVIICLVSDPGKQYPVPEWAEVVKIWK